MNPNPGVFGPHFWFVLHSVSFFYPESPTDTDMRRHKDFYESFVYMIPCYECKQHYKVLLTRYPIDGHLNSRDELSRWVVFLHNQINKKTGKKEVDYQTVVQNYTYAYTQSKFQIIPTYTRKYVYGGVFLLTLFILYERIYMKNKLFS